MTQKITPGDLFATLRTMKRRLSVLERRQEATAAAVSLPPPVYIEGMLSPGRSIDPLAGEVLAGVVWHPSGGGLTGVSLVVHGEPYDPPAGVTVGLYVIRDEISAIIDSFQHGAAEEWFAAREALKTTAGAPFRSIPFTVWNRPGRLSCARTWIPPLGVVVLSLRAADNTATVARTLFEFDSLPRG